MTNNSPKEQPFTIEQATFSARETELACNYAFDYDAVWEAVNNAATHLGFTVISANRQVGLSVAKPPFSLLNFGRRIAITFLKLNDNHTVVRGIYLHGMLCLESRFSRQETLNTLFRTALLNLDRPKPKPAPPSPPTEDHTAPDQPSPTPTALQPPLESEQTASQSQAAHSAPVTEPSSDSSHTVSQSSPAQAPSASSSSHPVEPKPVNLDRLDFRHTDFDNLPLTPPTGAEAARYRLRPPLQRKSGWGRSLGWFSLGLAIAILIFILSGGLALLAP